MSDPLPVTVIGGYLGAGKTTLVNHALRHADGQRLAILVNEFGALPIDEDLIEAQDDDLISIAGGCICCSFGSDLTAAMVDLAALNPAPDHVIIEASGVAIPGAIAASLSLLEGYRLDGICVLADAASILRQQADEYIGDTIDRQLADANLVLMTKSDLVDSAELDRIETALANGVPRAHLLRTVQGQVPNAVLLGRFAPDQLPAAGGHSDADYASVVVAPDGPVDAAAMAHDLATGGYGLVRAKGFVRDHGGEMALIQIVGNHVDVQLGRPSGRIGVVCIGLRTHIGVAQLARRYDTAH